ncbi:MAG TPA: prephenate dehydrogenase/arogenate dehydrogenase family protein [Terriglobales bacterium]|jgi:prephenate dehydrogenase|nr:prephenate dehydrogenase/arogenate dehydrogenase family protein [Terriglobales bacterium]
MIKQVTVVGTGLIGGSLALALRHRGVRVIGSDKPRVLRKAQEIGAIDVGIENPARACVGSEIVVLAANVGGIIDSIENLGPMLRRDVLLTDVGSTKVEILKRARSVFGSSAGSRFLGGHPMSGKEHSGIENADSSLFSSATWIFTPEAEIGDLAHEYISLIASLGTHVIHLSAAQHDHLVAWTSHLPQMLSTAFAAVLQDEAELEEKAHITRVQMQEVGGRALREMTRIAASPYSMWRDIALTNAANIEDAILKLEQRLTHIRENLRTPELRAEFERAARFKKPD